MSVLPATDFVEASGGRLVRLGADAARLRTLVLADPEASPAAIADQLGSAWTPEQVASSLAELERLELLDPVVRQVSRVAFRAPMSLQLTLLDPAARLKAFTPLFRRLLQPATAYIGALVALAGLAAATSDSALLDQTMHQPLPLWVYLTVIGAVLLSTALHEVAHAAVLLANGGKPRRLGVMIFYLSLAFFCDVTDAWRLSPRKRAEVALAGVSAHAVMGGAVALVAVSTSGVTAHAFLLFALVCYGYAVINLFPGVKLDGYLALSTWLDTPFLRAKAMDDYWRVLGRWLFGTRAADSPPVFRWSPAYGLLCSLSPAVLVVFALRTLVSGILGMGQLGAVLLLVAVAALLGTAARLTWHRVAGLWAVRGSAVRFGLGIALVAGSLVAIGGLVRVPYTLVGGLVSHGGEVAFPKGADLSPLGQGRTLDVRSSGLVVGGRIGSVTLLGGPRDCDADAAALLPVTGGGLRIPAECLAVSALSLPGSSHGSGRVVYCVRSELVTRWLWDALASPALRAF